MLMVQWSITHDIWPWRGSLDIQGGLLPNYTCRATDPAHHAPFLLGGSLRLDD